MMINSEEILSDFLNGASNDTFKEDEGDGWYWENVEDNDLYGYPSNTMKEALAEIKGA